MTCEGIVASCPSCSEDDVRLERQYADDLPKTLSNTYAQSSAAAPTPPDSPRSPAESLSVRSPNRDSSFSKTYNENDQKRDRPCESCALTVPTKLKDQIPDGAPGSSTKGGHAYSGSPVIRSRVPFKAMAPSEIFLQGHDSTSLDDGDAQEDSYRQRSCSAKHTNNSVTAAAPLRSSDGSLDSSSSTRTSHKHFLHYTSSRDPASADSYSKLRRSCLRTLSCETLPPSSIVSHLAPSSPTSFFSSSQYSMSSNSSFRASNPQIGGGGPIFFGDPQSGYTTAFIFRVRDPCARGQRRIYAFICLTQQKESKAMQAFGLLSKAFRELASWIQWLAEAENDKLDNAIVSGTSDGTRRGSDQGSVSSNFGGSTGSMVSGGSFGGSFGGGGMGRHRYSTGGGYSSSPRNRGLADLVGRPDIFLDLHAKFVSLAAQLTGLGL